MIQSSGNPFSLIKQVESAHELIDIAFNKAMKIKPPGSRMSGLDRSRMHEINRVNTVANVLASRIIRIVKQFPSLNLIHPFYFDLSSVLIDVNHLKISLGRIYGMVKFIRDLEFEIIEKIRTSNSKAENKLLRKSAFGRFSSMARQLSKHLAYLEEVRDKLGILPSFNPYLPSVVICGLPNTGKSSFVKLTTSGKPDVASYPFTTKKLIFGHRKFGFLDVQFVDTPGLLDRPLAERNEIELQALTALKHLSDIMVYLIDPTDQASGSLSNQMNLMAEIRHFYSSISFIPVISKIDLISMDKISEIFSDIKNSDALNGDDIDVLTMNSTSFDGVQEVLNLIDTLIKKKVITSPKFKLLTQPEIAEDQLPSEDDPMWFLEGDYISFTKE